MEEKLNIFDVWAIDYHLAWNYYFKKHKEPEDLYLTMILDSLNSFSDRDKKIVSNKDFIRNLIKNRDLPHGERLVQSLYELEGGILSDENMEFYEQAMKIPTYNFRENKYAVYESKFTFFDYLKATEEEIEEKKNAKFFNHCKLYLKGNTSFIEDYSQNEDKMNGVETLILENNNLSDSLRNFNFSFIKNLYLNNNNLTQIDENTLKEKLKHLDLSFNNFKNFTFYCLPLTIRSLNISNNPLREINLIAIKFLEILDLSDTEIITLEKLPKTITTLNLNSCKKLKTVKLSDNYIVNFNTDANFMLNMYDSYIDVLTSKNNNIQVQIEYSSINETLNTNLEYLNM